MLRVNMFKKLTEIGLKHGTDKAYFHLFTEFYNDFFETYLNKEINILEIGIATGKSILMLKEYFPKSTVYAIDINEDSVNLNLGDGINKYLCSQDDFEKLNKIFENLKFDIIIEDGSHMTSHQQSSLGFFFNFLNKNGIYICEDLHTSYITNFIDTKITTIDIIENYCKTKNFTCELLNNEQIEYLNKNILDIVIFKRDKNAIKCYNCQNNNDNLESCFYCNTNLSPFDESITSIIRHK